MQHPGVYTCIELLVRIGISFDVGCRVYAGCIRRAKAGTHLVETKNHICVYEARFLVSLLVLLWSVTDDAVYLTSPGPTLTSPVGRVWVGSSGWVRVGSGAAEGTRARLAVQWPYTDRISGHGRVQLPCI